MTAVSRATRASGPASGFKRLKILRCHSHWLQHHTRGLQCSCLFGGQRLPFFTFAEWVEGTGVRPTFGAGRTTLKGEERAARVLGRREKVEASAPGLAGTKGLEKGTKSDKADAECTQR